MRMTDWLIDYFLLGFSRDFICSYARLASLADSRRNIDIQNTKPQSIEDHVLQKLQPQKEQCSNIDRYFEEDLVTVHESVTKEKDWLFSWWRMYRDEYPRMAAAARDYLAVPASEVAVERLFSRGRDLLGVRRYSLNAETMRRVMLLRDAYKSEAPR